MPEATVGATRNLWFHTGDLARRDDDGYFYFVGRRTDSIRRRGENISAFEVEEVVKLHPHVLDAAAFGVPSELTEDDVMVAVVPRPGTALDPADLIDFCRERMARHMVPRYVDLVDRAPAYADREGREGEPCATWCHPNHLGQRGRNPELIGVSGIARRAFRPPADGRSRHARPADAVERGQHGRVSGRRLLCRRVHVQEQVLSRAQQHVVVAACRVAADPCEYVHPLCVVSEEDQVDVDRVRGATLLHVGQVALHGEVRAARGQVRGVNASRSA